MIAATVAALALAAGQVDAAVEVTPRSVRFGDTFEARATIAVEATAQSADELVVRFRPGPFDVIGEERQRSRSGRVAVIRIRMRLACRAEACVPGRRAREVRLPALRVGERDVAWPPVRVLPRVPVSAVEAEPPRFAIDTTPPAPTYRVDPERAIVLLAAVGLLLALAGASLLLFETSQWRAARPRVTGTPLERALARVRASLGATARERRRAVGALARLLEPAHRELWRSAAALAWAEPLPRPDDVAALADRVEREVSA